MAIRLPRNDVLIKEARIAAQEVDFDDEEEHGISDEFMLSALADASNFIHLYLVNERIEAFSSYKEISVAGAEYVTAPWDLFSDNLIYEVWYSETGDDGTFRYPLELMYSRSSYLISGVPEQYKPENGLIYFDIKPISGKIRVRYERAIDDPDLRRGKIVSVTGSLPSITAITIDVSGSDGGFYGDSDWETLPEYISINDKDGNVLMRNVPVASFDASSGEITLDTFTAEDEETCPVDAWVCFGGNSTTHIKLPRVSKTFFKEYIKAVVFEGRSQDDIQTANPRMATFLEQIAEVYSQLPSGFAGIPQRR